MSRAAYSIDEIEVSLKIRDGKITAESNSGAKSGSLEIDIEDKRAKLRLNGAGNDQGTAYLSGPELSNFRTVVDAAMSSMMADGDDLADDRRVLYSGFESLHGEDGDFHTTLDAEALRELGLLDAAGELPGGGRQVRCTVLNSGTAIINLLSEDEAEIAF